MSLSTTLKSMLGTAGGWAKQLLTTIGGIIPGFAGLTHAIASMFGAVAPAAAAATAATSATGQAQIMQHAGEAAAAQFANVIMTKPFPENLILAPAAAQAAFAQTVAFGEMGAFAQRRYRAIRHARDGPRQ